MLNRFVKTVPIHINSIFKVDMYASASQLFFLDSLCSDFPSTRLVYIYKFIRPKFNRLWLLADLIKMDCTETESLFTTAHKHLSKIRKQANASLSWENFIIRFQHQMPAKFSKFPIFPPKKSVWIWKVCLGDELLKQMRNMKSLIISFWW